ncbi:MAG: hypothetical protein WCF98_10795 [Synechococcus sp. ELA057]
MTSFDPSSDGSHTPAWSQRLVVQLQLLSEVTEQITYRLLELEERVGEGERSLSLMQEEGQGAEAIPAAMEDWLEETEQRLGRVEELLRGPEIRGSSAGRTLQAVASSIASIDPEAIEAMDHVDATESQEHPFHDEEEQLFLDEQQIA